MNPDLIKVTEIFLIPSSFLVAALGTADTNPHRAAISLVGLIISVLWMVCSVEAMWARTAIQTEQLRTARRWILAWLPVVFILGWLSSTIIHWLLWRQPIEPIH